MKPGSNETIVGTEEGILRVGHGDVTPLTSDGARILCLVGLVPGEFVAGAAGGQIFRSSRNGTEWHRSDMPDSSRSDIISLHTCNGSPTRIFAATVSGSVFVSADRGRTFDLVSALDLGPFPVALSGIAARPYSVIAVSAEPDLWISQDGGENFQRIVVSFSEMPTASVAVAPDDPDCWTIPCSAGFLVSDDAGKQFELVPQNEPGSPVAVQYGPAAPFPLYALHRRKRDQSSGLMQSEDHGRTWSAFADNPLNSLRDPTGLVTCFAFRVRRNQCEVVVGTDRGEVLLLRDNEEGEVLADGLPPIHTLYATTMDGPVDPSMSGVYVLP